MMMNQGESTGSVASLEKHQMNDSQQIHPSSYFSPNCAVASWNTQAENHSSRENGVLSTSGYNHDQLVDPTSQIAQDGSNVAPIVSSSSVPPNVAQGYNGYAAHPNTDPYGYSSTSYAAYYNQYQHQPSQYEQQPSQHQQQPSQYEQQPNQYQQQPNQYQQQPSQYQPQPSQYQQQPSQYQQQPSQYEQQPNQYQQQPSQFEQQPSQFEQQPSQYQPQPSQYEPQPSQYEQQPSQQQPNQYQQHTSQYQQQPSQFQQQPSQYQQQPSQYQQQSTQSYPHQVGAYQNTGAPHQPLSSFQNTGSYAGPASYSSTYHNAGDYQTSGSYTSGSYGTQDTQTNAWPGGQYATYSSHQYQNYTQDSNSAYSSTSAVATSQYQQHCKQWEEYYNQTQTEVSCAPGTEKPPVSVASGVSSYVPSGSIAHTTPNSQMPTAYTPSWRPESSSSEMNSMQPVGVSGSTPEWQHGVSVFQTDATNSVQTHAQKPLEVIPAFEKFQNQQNSSFSQGSTAMYPVSYQVSQSLQSFQTVLQPSEPLDSNKASKLIPTNPRIASNLPLSLLRSDKDRSVTSGTAKPAYVSIPLPKPDEKVKSHDEADTMLKPGMFPKSLRGYVERALARCKSDGQKSACQAIMKEVITLATADGTLYTKDWDTEPLFPMPNTDSVDKYDKLFPPLTSAMPKSRSPSRRAKSRWEPAPEEKMVHKSASISPGTVVHGSWNNKKVSGGKTENNDYSGSRFSYTYQKNFSKNVTRPAKRQRLGEDLKAADDGESSSDSDKEQSLTKYYSAATALADTPEEKKRREDRSKRFDKGHGNRAGKNNFRAKDVGPGKLYTKRASALVLSRTFEESGSRAVEDIDWNALTVKGTCQEIEKRYLRLTSAPDPATVRPEEVLEKSLLMVQNSQKNYLYKCDQLKSIRQDLTVQHIRNELTVKVYETHARFAIEVGDLPEYNQCQSQLKTLYAEGIVGCHMEFAAYNLLCVIMHSNNNRDLVSAMSRLPANAKKDKGVKHALSVRSAVTSGNYVMFFRLYKTAPNLNTFLMDLYVEKMRYAAVKCITRSYRPTVPVSYLSQILGFANNALPTSEEDDEKELDGVEECMEWLKAHGASIISDSSGETSLDTKVSVSTLFMPDPEDAVSHGDATLAVNDFLTRSIAQVN